MIHHHDDLIQGSEAWLQARCGLLTASELRLIISPATLKPAANDKASSHLYELLAQRITGHVEPQYISDAMLRGQVDEIEARALYARHYNPVTEAGFITRDDWGFTLGYSPDGLVGDDGLIEIKSRAAKFQAETIITGQMPTEYRIQVQTGMLVTGRKWCDFISYCAGMPMAVVRVASDPEVQAAILDAADFFERRLAHERGRYDEAVATRRMVATERRIEQEMIGL